MRTSEGEHLLPRSSAGTVHNERGCAVPTLGLLGGTGVAVAPVVVGNPIHGRHGGHPDGIVHDAHNDGRIVREAGGVQSIGFGRSEGSKVGLFQCCLFTKLLSTTGHASTISFTTPANIIIIIVVAIHIFSTFGPVRPIPGIIIAIGIIVTNTNTGV